MNWNHEETLKTFFSSMAVIYTSDKPKPSLVLIFWTTVDVAFLKYKYTPAFLEHTQCLKKVFKFVCYMIGLIAISYTVGYLRIHEVSPVQLYHLTFRHQYYLPCSQTYYHSLQGMTTRCQKSLLSGVLIDLSF